MANAKKCDVCGEMYSKYNTVNNANEPNCLRLCNETRFGGFVYHPVIDLCPECMNKVLTALNKKNFIINKE